MLVAPAGTLHCWAAPVYEKVTVQTSPTQTSSAAAAKVDRLNERRVAIIVWASFFMPEKVKLPAESCRELSTAPQGRRLLGHSFPEILG